LHNEKIKGCFVLYCAKIVLKNPIKNMTTFHIVNLLEIGHFARNPELG